MANAETDHQEKYVIVVNAEEFTLDHQAITFKELIELAYPTPPSPETRFTVTFYDAHDPREGTLKGGAAVEVKKKDTVFNVKPTVKS